MIESIEMNKNYAIYLSDLYGSTKSNVQIIGTTVIDSLSKNDDEYNIYQTYFEPFGLGISTYYTAIQSDTVIYICAPIESLEPFSLNLDEKIYIPASIIDMDKSSEYTKCYNINFTIYPIIKHFDTDDERDEYIEKIKTQVKNRLNNLIDFNTLGLEIDSSYAPIYMTTEDNEALEEERSTNFDKYVERVNTYNRNQEAAANAINEKLQSLSASKTEYENLVKEETNKVIKLNNLIEQYEKLIKLNTGN